MGEHTMLDSELDLHRPAEPTHTTPAAGERRTPRILVAADAEEPPREVLELARELAVLFGGELHLLRVNASDGTVSRSEPARAPSQPSVISVVERHGHSIARADGEFVATVAAYALELNATLVIVPGYLHRGRRVLKLVRSSGCAVLVARRNLMRGMVLAATDLGDPRFPVIRQAGALGALAQTAVVAVHNVPPARVALDVQGERLARIESDTRVTSRQLQTLVEATSTFKIQTAVLTCLLDPVAAILREARDRDASLVVVGTHLDGRAAKRSSVSVDVVNLAATSVLVVPVSKAEAARVGARVGPEPVPAR